MLPLRTPNHRRTARTPGRWIPGTVGTAAAAGVLTHGVLPRILGKWGAAGSEVSMPLPGDHLIPEPGSVQTMAVAIAAPPEQVWPWLVQMGVDRAGLYSYTWVENGLLHLGVTNADRIHPEWQDLAVGDIIAFTPARYPGGRMGPRVVELERGRHLVLDASPGAPAGTVTGTWQFILHAADDGGTRLLLRTRSSLGRPAALRFLDFLLQPAYLVMDRAMLLGIKQRAERGTPKKEQAGAESPLT
jgi:hypothetical protein